jgi:hypothetical protein
VDNDVGRRAFPDGPSGETAGPHNRIRTRLPYSRTVIMWRAHPPDRCNTSPEVLRGRDLLVAVIMSGSGPVMKAECQASSMSILNKTIEPSATSCPTTMAARTSLPVVTR